jgi:hypothetical protein
MPTRTIEVHVPEGMEVGHTSQNRDGSTLTVTAHLFQGGRPVDLTKLPNGVIAELSGTDDFDEPVCVEARGVVWDKDGGEYHFLGRNFKFCRISKNHAYNELYSNEFMSAEGVSWSMEGDNLVFDKLLRHYCMPHELRGNDDA